jgi:hypothetical protein
LEDDLDEEDDDLDKEDDVEDNMENEEKLCVTIARIRTVNSSPFEPKGC